MEGGGRVPRNDREELQRRMDALENWEQDPNSSVVKVVFLTGLP